MTLTEGWLQHAGAWTVEHVPCPHPNVKVDLSVPAKGVQHTTEGSTIEAALAVFRRSDTPTFSVGVDANKRVRVLQHVPLGYMAAALMHTVPAQPTNGYARVQIELVAFSHTTPWLPDPKVMDALASLYRALVSAAGVPLTHFTNPKRSFKVWQNTPGWCGHADVPQNAHWDPGALDFGHLFAAASAPIKRPVVKPKPRHPILTPQTYTLVRRSNGLVYSEHLERPH